MTAVAISRRTIAAIAIAVGVLTFAYALIVIAAPTPTTPDFPAFTMRVEDWQVDLTDGKPGTQEFLIEYRAKDDWKVTLISHSNEPQRNGSSSSFQRGVSTSFDAWRNYTRTYTVEPGSINAVDRWLIPGLDEHLVARGWTRTAADPGRVIVRHDDQVAREGRTSSVRTQVTFDVRTRMATQVEVTVDGQVVERISYRKT